VQSVFSHSSLSCFEKCPRQYAFRYVERIPAETESIEAFLGKRVHEVLERLYEFAGRGLVPSLRRVVERFRVNWEQGFDAARVRVVRRELGPDEYRCAGERCLEGYYRRHYPFDADETLGLERPVQVCLDGGGYRLRGIIDRLVRARDGVLEIHDFKTSGRVPGADFFERDRQLALYELGVRQELGEHGEVRLVWHYLLQSQLRVSSRTPAKLEALAGSLRELIDQVRAETRFEPRPGPLCDWCEYRGICPAFADAVPVAPVRQIARARAVTNRSPLDEVLLAGQQLDLFAAGASCGAIR
jgi:putative RecB family exonuclease